MPLAIDLLHHITRLLDISGANTKQLLHLSEESIKELDEHIFTQYPHRVSAKIDAKDDTKQISIDGYDFTIIKNKK